MLTQDGSLGPKGPPQCTIAVPSPKFHATSMIDCPCAVVDELASNTICCPTAGLTGEEVNPAVGDGGLPGTMVWVADSVD